MSMINKIKYLILILIFCANSAQSQEQLFNFKTKSIEVIDNGKGIGEDVKDLIFEPKFTTKTSGMWLGLPIIKKIIEAYNGYIAFTSNKTEGTIFTVTLPKK